MRRFERLVLACAVACAVVGLACAVAEGDPDGRPSRWEAAIEQALNEPTEFDFVDRPLTDVAAELQARYKIPIQLDEAALTDAGYAEDTLITAALSNVSLGSALKFILREMELTYIIRHEVLLITSQTEADGILETRVYPVGDLVRPYDETAVDVRPDFDRLIEAITATKPPSGWSDDDFGYIGEFADLDALIISQTAEEHERIEKLLVALRATRDKQATHRPHDQPRQLTSEPELSLAQAALKNALNAKTSIDFVDRPLTDVVEYLEPRHKIEIELDRRALTDIGVREDTPMTAKGSGISLASALELMLGPLELTHVIRDDVLLITSKTEAEGMLDTRVYPVADLVRPPDDRPLVEPSPDFESLIEIVYCIEPTTWSEYDVQEFDNCGALVIPQTAGIHDQIEKLLTALREARRNALGDQRSVELPPDNGLTLKAYRVPLFWQADQAKSEQELVHAIPNVLEPATWQTAGGAGTIRSAAGLLWIEQTEAVHRQIGRLLAALE